MGRQERRQWIRKDYWGQAMRLAERIGDGRANPASVSEWAAACNQAIAGERECKR